MQVTETIELDVTMPIRVDGDPDGSETLLTWLRTNKLLFLATGKHFQRFCEVLQNEELAFTIFRQVSSLRRAKEKQGFEGGNDTRKVAQGFRRLEKVRGLVFNRREA